MASKRPGEEGGIKDIFAQHVEKMVLGVAVLLVFVFLWFGTSHKPLPKERNADSLEGAVDRAERNIAQKTILEEFRALGITPPVFHEQAQEAAVVVDYKKYQVSWVRPPYRRKLEPRLDPHLIAPAELEVEPGVIAAITADGDGGAAGGGLGEFAPGPRRGGIGDLIGGDAEEGVPPELREDQLERLQQGFQPGRGTAVEGTAFVAVRAIVPIIEQQEEYNRCFVKRMGYQEGSGVSLQRDLPSYIYFYAERQEIGPDGNPVPIGTGTDGQPQVWKRLNTKQAMLAAQGWMPVEEPADPRFLHERLTMPPPPVLLRDINEFVMHSKVPRLMLAEEETPEEGPPPEEGEDVPPDVPDFPGASERPGEEGLRPPGLPAEGFEGGPDGVMAGPVPDEPAEYRLVRFYDFDVDPRKRYRYRVRLLLEDPNNPRDENMAPSDRTLDTEVLKRLSAQRAKDPADRRTFWRETEWSEPSGIVGFPPLGRVLTGAITAARTIEVPGQRATIVVKEALAKVMALSWDAEQAVWVPGVFEDIARGAVRVNFEKDTWVLDPVALTLRELKGHKFHTGYTVADMLGGEKLPSTNRKSKLTVPGEVLLLADDGSLHVSSETLDADTYWLYYYGPEEEVPTGRRRPGREEPEGGIPPTEFEGLLEGT